MALRQLSTVMFNIVLAFFPFERVAVISIVYTPICKKLSLIVIISPMFAILETDKVPEVTENE